MRIHAVADIHGKTKKKDIPIPILSIRGNSDLNRVEGLLRVQKNSLVVNCAMNKTCSGAIIDYDKDMHLKIKMLINNKHYK